MFVFAPERAHHITVALLRFVLKLPLGTLIFKLLYKKKHPGLERRLLGLTFANPVGLAAGFDKDGKHFRAMAALGFGFIEIGTVTPRPQAGNPQPRLFRLPQDKGLINRMGFNNEGVDALAERLKKGRPAGVVIGGNIGKNKDTPNEQAASDYVYCFERLFDHVDYFVVNVSSPNTPGLRALQDREPLTALLRELQRCNAKHPERKPILLKIAPDLTPEQLDDIISIVKDAAIDGVIATNTTIARDGLKTPQEKLEKIGNGGLSGAPLRQRATEVIRYLREKGGSEMVIIGVGGIASAEDALEKLNAGANLVQVYTGLIYAGPALVRQINKAVLI